MKHSARCLAIALAIAAFLSLGTASLAVNETAAIYMAPQGSDASNGSRENPVATFAKARDLARQQDIDHIAMLPGEYFVEQISLDKSYNDLTIYADGGEVILNGGLVLEPADFKKPEDDVLARLMRKAKKNVKAINLAALGLTSADWGKLYSYGFGASPEYYDGGEGPLQCEIYYNGNRCTTARYPNTDACEPWLKIGAVHEKGAIDIRQTDPKTERNQPGGTFEMDKKTTERVKGWSDSNDIWIFGMFRYEWADAATQVKEINGNLLSTMQANDYGFAEYGSEYGETGGRYYFYNVLEELDAPGEWYLNRETGMLYLWPPKGNFNKARIELSLSTKTLIEGEGLDNIRLQGITMQGMRGDAVVLKGDNMTIDNCTVQNISGNAINIEGFNNVVSNCEIMHVGQSGITINGGDLENLTPGNSKAENNLIHDWGEVISRYKGGIEVYGVGNIAAHNELYDAPHTAIWISRIDTPPSINCVIEYNLIHDVCLDSADAGAIYGGRSWWAAQGTTIRYNYIHDIGSGDNRPSGIYLDDALSGVTVQSNLIVNVPTNGIFLGGGRDLTVQGNVIVNSQASIFYDDRARAGVLQGGPLFKGLRSENDPMWALLRSSPWQTEPWKAAFPKLAVLSSDFDNTDNPSFAPNPAGSLISGNVCVGAALDIWEAPNRFSTIENNPEYKLCKQYCLFKNPCGGNYRLRKNAKVFEDLPGFEEIPLDQIGRQS